MQQDDHPALTPDQKVAVWSAIHSLDVLGRTRDVPYSTLRRQYSQQNPRRGRAARPRVWEEVLRERDDLSEEKENVMKLMRDQSDVVMARLGIP